MLNQKVNTSGNNIISGSLEANIFRCGEIKLINDDGLNALILTQLTTNKSIIGSRTEESVASMYLNIKGSSYIGWSTTGNITLYRDTTIDETLTTGNTTIHGDLTVTGNLTYNGDSSSEALDAQILTLNKPSNDSVTPLQLINNSQNWEVIALESTISGDDCLHNLKTAQSSIVWNTGIWDQNQYGIRHGVNGLWIYDNGNTTMWKSRCRNNTSNDFN